MCLAAISVPHSGFVLKLLNMYSLPQHIRVVIYYVQPSEERKHRQSKR